jgi:hypothetical protein
MFKRTVGIGFMLLVNLFLLALTIVPHHHHGEAVCFVSAHCRHCVGDVVECPLHGEEHDTPHSHDADGCSLSEWLLPNINEEQKHQAHGDDLVYTVHDFPQTIIYLAPDCPFNGHEGPLLLERPAFFSEPYLQVFVSRTFGLRAPPFC